MEICTIGGYEEVGRNMTAVKIDEDVFIFDIGLNIPGVIELQDESFQDYSEKQLRKFDAIPDDRILDKMGWREKVRAIFVSHAHLDHVGGIPYLANRYSQANIYGTPFTMAVLESILQDEKIKLGNKRVVVKEDSTFFVKGQKENYKIDFIHTTHSTLQCSFIALHTKEGVFFYALDLKFDNYPTMGKKPNYQKMKELQKIGVKVLIVDSLYSSTEKKPGSETIARHLLEEAFSKVRNRNSAFFITTFSSHIERLKNIVEFAKKTRRQIVFLGRSLNKYVNCSLQINQCPFAKDITLVKYRNQVDSFLRKVEKERGKYLVVCTGHQAEKGSILDRIVRGETPFNFHPEDHLIFSSSIIPAPENVLAREKMDKKLRKIGVKLQPDIHVHGHGSREDLREIVNLLRPKHIIPAHGSLQQETPMIELANEFGYIFHETSHLCPNGKLLKI
jgi:ribonuclease J